MRAFVLYFVGFLIIYIYNGRICPFVSDLPAWQIGFIVFIPLAVGYMARTILFAQLVLKQKLTVQASFVGWIDFSIFIVAGLGMLAFNTIVYGFPFVESGLKVFMGTFTVGFFVAIDLALQHNRNVMQMSDSMKWTYSLPQVYYPITTKFFFFGTVTIVLFATLIIAVVTRDLFLLSSMPVRISQLHIMLTRKSIIIDIAFIMLVLLGFIVNLLYSYSLNLRMLFKAQTGILERVTEGDMDEFVPVMTSDEFGVIAGHTNTMITGLRDRIRMMEGLKVAGEMQQTFFPKKRVEYEGLDIAATSIFSDETGGDFFDFLEGLGDAQDETVVVLGDVTGHGIGAALLMATTRAYLRMQAEYEHSPAHLLSNTNALLARDCYGTGRFVTLFCLQLSGEQRQIKWASAGHDPALVFDANTQEFRELKAHGLPLGVLPDTKYEEVCCDSLRSGEVMLIGTDGIWEATDSEQNMFGKERLKAVIRKNYNQTSAGILHAVANAVKDFRGEEPQLDDITIVVLKAE
ncbi:SpoIIE family protein phosphatase [Halodesulfovibrio sp.]|jgi:sigma-B regulation protein RsbU (phosphoserine phosphatase)|uniref:SpoIIE family protein phosphatase n=1 Tax=Halodesulfovibrio sp. TaxID=1912772 RepID=UPI0025D20F80|nr:SpoIIE family protein phosphatase [Halodesulfovibrio sp.]MCT4626036.1 SpoIIE family protein phosphatase [Halodesulfovibrio sp.]